jgi:hypothetical protein
LLLDSETKESDNCKKYRRSNIEFSVKRKKQRVWITTPDGDEPVFEEVKVDNTLLKALLKAHLWTRKIQRGSFENISELCKHYKINDSYASKILNLRYLSPKLKEMIIEGKQPKHMRLQDLIYEIPLPWVEQEKKFL